MINIKVNNKRMITLTQNADESIRVETINSEGIVESVKTIQSWDMVTMLNWYQYQKITGNTELYY